MFRFKQFSVRQDRCPMKVGTDGVLVGAWSEVKSADRRMLDIGTGTGLIALMLAQRAPGARITGIDVDDVSQARENADASPWGGRVEVVQCPVQDFVADGEFDLIVSNPPFFVDSLTCPDQGRTAVRHAVLLPYEELRNAVVRLLAPGGRFCAVLPTTEAARFIGVCAPALRLTRRTDVRTTPRRPAKRVLMEFRAAAVSLATSVPSPSVFPGNAPSASDLSAASAAVSPPVSPGAAPAPLETPLCSELIVGTGEHECYTPEYRALTRDFYLKF